MPCGSVAARFIGQHNFSKSWVKKETFLSNKQRSLSRDVAFFSVYMAVDVAASRYLMRNFHREQNNEAWNRSENVLAFGLSFFGFCVLHLKISSTSSSSSSPSCLIPCYGNEKKYVSPDDFFFWWFFCRCCENYDEFLLSYKWVHMQGKNNP
jgi:hypothetical protein